MDEKNRLNDEPIELPREGSGSLLAKARKQQNRSVDEIADELNLSVTQIRTIELDQSEGLPEPTYVRGYIRAYAKLLGLDADRILEHYLNPNWQKGSRLDEIPRGIGSADENDEPGFFTPGRVLSLVVLVAVFGALWLTGKLDGLLGDSSVDVAEPTSVRSSELSSPSAAETPNSSVIDPPTSAEGVAPEPTEVVEEAVIAHQLTLNFVDTSWVDIRDVDGKRLAYKTYTEGESLVVQSATPMSVFIGNARAVTATYNGDAYDINQHREGAFARFFIGEQ